MNDEIRRDSYDRILGSLEGIPGVRKARASTVTTVLPMLGNSQTHVVQTYHSTEEGFYVFVQIVDADGRARIALPPKVVQALYRQHDALIKAGRKARAQDRWSGTTKEERSTRTAHLRKAAKA